jgi:hypothetical protein
LYFQEIFIDFLLTVKNTIPVSEFSCCGILPEQAVFWVSDPFFIVPHQMLKCIIIMINGKLFLVNCFLTIFNGILTGRPGGHQSQKYREDILGFSSRLLRFARKTSKNRFQAIFYLANCQSMPNNRDFCVIGDAKIHKRNRLLDLTGITAPLFKKKRYYGTLYVNM